MIQPLAEPVARQRAGHLHAGVRDALLASMIGAAIAVVSLLPGLGIGTLWDNSETAYGEVAREILLYGDPVVMHLNGAPWFVQPPLYFWIAALFAKALGVAPFALRLPSALATVAIGGGIAYAVSRLRGTRAALLSSTIASTMLMQVIVGRLAIMDALLDLAVAATIGSIFAALRGPSLAWWYAGWIAAGFGVLTKGPVAFVIPLLVIVAWALWERRFCELRIPHPLHWAGGFLALAAVVAPWTLSLANSAGGGALVELVGHYTFGRYVGTIENQAGPFWYYLPVLILGTFPWFAFLIPSLGSGFEAARRQTSSLERLCLVWSIVPFAFFSLAQTKLPNYIALEFPALAILMGLWFDALPERESRRPAILWAMIVPISLAIVGIAIVAFSRDNRLGAGLATMRPLIAALLTIVFAGWAGLLVMLARRSTSGFAAYPLAVAGVLAVGAIVFVGEPLAEAFKPIPVLAKVIRGQAHGGDAIAIGGVRGGNALVFYTRPRVTTLDDANAGAGVARGESRDVICGSPRAFVVTSATRPATNERFGRTRHELSRTAGDVLLLYDGPQCVPNR